jgi:hypothetical protein
MYRISSTNQWHNGRKFDSLAAAKAYADKHGDSCVCDVIRDVDTSSFQAVTTGGNTFAPVNVGQFSKSGPAIEVCSVGLTCWDPADCKCSGCN